MAVKAGFCYLMSWVKSQLQAMLGKPFSDVSESGITEIAKLAQLIGTFGNQLANRFDVVPLECFSRAYVKVKIIHMAIEELRRLGS